MRHIGERLRDEARRRPGEVRFDEHHLRDLSGHRAQRLVVEWPDDIGIDDRHVTVTGGGQHGREGRADGKDDGSRAAPYDVEATGTDGVGGVVLLCHNPDVLSTRVRHRQPHCGLDLFRGARDVDRPRRERVDEGDVGGGMVGPAAVGDVEGAARADKDAADVLMVEAELDLLEGAFHQEGAERVHDRPQAGEGQSGADVDQQLLADADVDDPVGVPALDVVEVLAADLGVDEGDRPVFPDQAGGRSGERLTW